MSIQSDSLGLPPSSGFDLPSDRLVRALAVAGCLAIVLGAKFWLVTELRAVMPVWDEWVEALLYRAYDDGTLGFADLVQHHNEHRILVPRLTLLATFIAAGQWDLVLSAMIGNLVHIAAIGCLLGLLNRALGMTGTLLLALMAVPLLAIPFAFDNAISGFQVQFYEVILFSTLSLWLLSRSAAWTLKWWLGSLLGVLSYFCMASGAFTLPAAIACAAVQLAVGRRSGRGELVAMLLHAVIAAVMIWDVPRVTPVQALSFAKAFEVFSLAASWPISKTNWPLLGQALVALAIQAPVITLTIKLVRLPPRLDDVRWFYPVMAGWSVLQLLLLIYGRSGVLVPRYMDLLTIALLVNAAAVFHLAFAARERWRGAVVLAAAIWVSALLIGLSQKAISDLSAGLAWRREAVEAQNKNFLEYLATGDLSALENKPRFHIPYPDAGPLEQWTSDPAIRAVLPPALFGQPEPKLKTTIMRNGRYLMPFGFALLMIACMVAGIRAAGRITPSDT